MMAARLLGRRLGAVRGVKLCIARSAASRARPVHTEARLKSLGIELPAPGTPKANYNIVCWESPTLLYMSGHLPIRLDGTMVTGAIGPGGRSLEDGQEAARWCGLNLIATMQDQLGGDLDRVEKVVKLFGIVSSTAEFKEQHLVLNGASDVMMQCFEARRCHSRSAHPEPEPDAHASPSPNPDQERGYHARSAIGTNTLPLDISVEVEAIVKVKP